MSFVPYGKKRKKGSQSGETDSQCYFVKMNLCEESWIINLMKVCPNFNFWGHAESIGWC